MRRAPHRHGRPVASCHPPCERLIPALTGHLLPVPPGPALQVRVQDQQLLHPHRRLEHVPHRCKCNCRSKFGFAGDSDRLSDTTRGGLLEKFVTIARTPPLSAHERFRPQGM